MSYDPIANPVFRCYQTAANPAATCYKLKVVVAELDEAVMTIIRKQAEVILGDDNLIGLRKSDVTAQQISDYEIQMNSLMEQRKLHYEQFITREIDRQTYLSVKSDCTEQIERLNERLSLYRQSATRQPICSTNCRFCKKRFIRNHNLAGNCGYAN
jgi:hypothetical protein